MYYDFCIELTSARLRALDGLIDTIQTQAKDRGLSDSEILEMRLAPDMFPFAKQIQIASDNAKWLAARLWGKEIPAYEDNESTLADLQARLRKTIAFLDTFTREDFIGAETREARFPYFPGVHMVGKDYLVGYAIPNFLFHVVTAYDILRHHGFEIGKQNFMQTLPLVPDAK